jgi:hypothetical protein
LSQHWKRGRITDAEYASLYFIYWQIALHGRAFAARRNRNDPKPDPDHWLETLSPGQATGLTPLLLTRLESFQFKGVIPAVARALAAWLRGSWPLTLLERIPDAHEVLVFQVQGTRPVTLLAGYPRLLQPALARANGLDFMTHDLEHACKFFGDETLHRLQHRFFTLLLRADARGLLNPWPGDAVFASHIDYLVSDMNTHPVHGLRYLSANLIDCLLRQEGKNSRQILSAAGEATLRHQWVQLAGCWQFSSCAEAALLKLVSDSFTATEARTLEKELLSMSAQAIFH